MPVRRAVRFPGWAPDVLRQGDPPLPSEATRGSGTRAVMWHPDRGGRWVTCLRVLALRAPPPAQGCARRLRSAPAPAAWPRAPSSRTGRGGRRDTGLETALGGQWPRGPQPGRSPFTRLRPSDDEPERLCPEVRGQTVTSLYLSPSEDAPSPCPWEGRQLPGTPGFSRKADRLRCRAS